MTDHDLLRRYARENSQAAFTELVARHLNLVYSAALRQIRSAALAEDIAQSVFLDLARHAHDLPADQPLAAWLHVVTRRTAIDAIRHESRRTAREHTAAQLAATHAMPPSSPSTWSQLEPHLDEAVAALPDPDRHAILLRYFANKSLREIGESLGTTDDAAQKRVSRALDQLRTLLLRRGLTVTAAGLATDLSAHAILTAPVALTGAIATSTAALSIATAAASAAKTILMTTLQKSLVTAALVITAGAGLFQAVVFARQDSALADLHVRTSEVQRQLAAAQREQTALTQRLRATDAAIDARLSQARQGVAARDDAALDATLAAWLTRARRLKSFAAARPDLSIPEFRLLTDEHWAEIAAQGDSDATVDSDAALHKALAAARKKAEGLFAPQLQTALTAFLRTSDNELPTSLYELLPHFASPIAPELFSRYRLTHTGKLSAVPERPRSTFLIEIEPTRVVDPNTDNIVSIGLYGSASHSAKTHSHTREIINRRAQATPSP